jgi:hypothetical protein
VCLWYFPIIAESGRPRGDGLTWKTNTLTESFQQGQQPSQNAGNHNSANVRTNVQSPSVNNQQNLEMRQVPGAAQNYGSNNYNSTSPFSPQRNNF